MRREQIKLQVALITPLIHVKGYAAPETKPLLSGHACLSSKPSGCSSLQKTRCYYSRPLGVLDGKLHRL